MLILKSDCEDPFVLRKVGERTLKMFSERSFLGLLNFASVKVLRTWKVISCT